MDLLHLAHSAGLYSDEGAGEVFGRGKAERVDDFDGAAVHFIRLLLREMVRVRLIQRNDPSGTRAILIRYIGRRLRPRENIQLPAGQIIKRRDIGAQVLGEDLLGRAFEEFRDEGGAALREAAVVEDEQEFGAVAEGLDAVRDPGGEEPDVAGLEVVDENFARFVARDDAYAAVEDEGPFVGLCGVYFSRVPRVVRMEWDARSLWVC